MRKSIKNPLTIIQNWSRNHQNPSKIDAQIEAQKKQDFFLKKVTFRIAVGIIDLEPKVVQNGIQKSWKIQHRKSMLKWRPKGRKGMENCAKMASKIMKKQYKIRCRKKIKNTSKKWFKFWQKIENSLKHRSKIPQKSIQNPSKIDQKSIKNP